MPKRLAITIVVASLGLILISFLRNAAVVEPGINGRTVSAWIRALANSKEEDEARKNLTELGPVGIPYIVAAIHRSTSFSTKAHSKVTGLSPAMRRFLGEPFPWSFVRTDLAEVLGRIGTRISFRTPRATRRPHLKFKWQWRR